MERLKRAEEAVAQIESVATQRFSQILKQMEDMREEA